MTPTRTAGRTSRPASTSTTDTTSEPAQDTSRYDVPATAATPRGAHPTLTRPATRPRTRSSTSTSSDTDNATNATPAPPPATASGPRPVHTAPRHRYADGPSLTTRPT
ncbi:hypothetical protein ACFQ7W_37330 [Streptomyces niveus]|uniref:hypothetical protein n=1 Tax=Streptomyces niveus TaxID=193462 RepID=UPI0036942F35